MILAPLRATADPSFARAAARKSGRWAAGYLAYLGLLFAAGGTFALERSFGPRWSEALRWAAASMPRVEIKEGRATSAPPGRRRLQHPGPPAWTLLVDTARVSPVAPEELKRENADAFLAGDAFYLRSIAPEGQGLYVYEFSRMRAAQPLVLDAAFYTDLSAAVPRILYPAAFAGAWLLFVLWKAVASCAYAALAAMLGALHGARLAYGAAWKLALVAQTPVVLLQIAQLFSPAPIPFFSAVALLVVAAYLWQLVRMDGEGGPTRP